MKYVYLSNLFSQRCDRRETCKRLMSLHNIRCKVQTKQILCSASQLLVYTEMSAFWSGRILPLASLKWESRIPRPHGKTQRNQIRDSCEYQNTGCIEMMRYWQAHPFFGSLRKADYVQFRPGNDWIKMLITTLFCHPLTQQAEYMWCVHSHLQASYLLLPAGAAVIKPEVRISPPMSCLQSPIHHRHEGSN